MSMQVDSIDEHVSATQLHEWGMNERSAITFPTSLFEKIVRRRRGGVCFEQNVLLAWLLHSLGFGVEILKAHVNRSLRGVAPTFNMIAPTHVCLRVRVPGDESDYYVDCGLGPSALAPMRFDRLGERQLELNADGETRRTWLIDTVAAGLELCGDVGPWTTVSFQEPTSPHMYERLYISPLPWRSVSEIDGALDFIHRSPISWFVLTVIVIRSSDRQLFVLQNGTLVVTDVRSGHSTTHERIDPKHLLQQSDDELVVYSAA